MSSHSKPFWLYVIELKQLHGLHSLEQAKNAADELWPAITEDGRFFYRLQSKGLVSDEAKDAFLKARRTSLDSPQPNSPGFTEKLQVKLAVASLEITELKRKNADLTSTQARRQSNTEREIEDMAQELKKLRATNASLSNESGITSSRASSTESAECACDHNELHALVAKLEDWHKQTSSELVDMRNKRIELVKKIYDLETQLKISQRKLTKVPRRHDPLSDWPED